MRALVEVWGFSEQKLFISRCGGASTSHTLVQHAHSLVDLGSRWRGGWGQETPVWPLSAHKHAGSPWRMWWPHAWRMRSGLDHFKGTFPMEVAWKGDRTAGDRVHDGGETKNHDLLVLQTFSADCVCGRPLLELFTVFKCIN